MKKMLLAALAGFTVAFAAGIVSTPPAEAQEPQSWMGCRSDEDCDGYGQVYCAGDMAICWSDGWINRGQCICP